MFIVRAFSAAFVSFSGIDAAVPAPFNANPLVARIELVSLSFHAAQRPKPKISRTPERQRYRVWARGLLSGFRRAKLRHDEKTIVFFDCQVIIAGMPRPHSSMVLAISKQRRQGRI
jgi:hypothetical protein